MKKLLIVLALLVSLNIGLNGSHNPQAVWGDSPLIKEGISGRVFSETDSEIKRLKEALNEKDLATKIWAIRSLVKYPPALSGPLLLDEFNKRLSEDTLNIRCVIVYCLGQMEYTPAIPQLVQILKMDLDKYGWTPPELFKEELEDLRKLCGGKKDNDPVLAPNLRERLANTRQKMLENYNQKLNWGLLHIRTMQVLGKFKSKEATDELYRLITTKEIPLSYLAIDTLKLTNDPKVIELLTKDSIIYWQPQFRERLIYTITELTSPYYKNSTHEGTEWLKKSLFKLITDELNRAGQSNDRMVRTLNIMDLLSRPNCQIYDFSSENNLIKEFTDLTNLLKNNNPEIMFYDHDLLIKFIKDEMLMKALYNVFSDALKPSQVIITLTPSYTPEAPKSEPANEKDKPK
jgi:hypothetical protein